MKKSKFLTEDNCLELVLDSFILKGKVEDCFPFSMLWKYLSDASVTVMENGNLKLKQRVFKISVSDVEKHTMCAFI